MFKKTLIALAVADVSVSANASILSADLIKGSASDNSTTIAALNEVDGCARQLLFLV